MLGERVCKEADSKSLRWGRTQFVDILERAIEKTINYGGRRSITQ